VVRDKVGRPPGELGVSKSMECDIFPFSAFSTLLVGRQQGHPACKKLGVGLTNTLNKHSSAWADDPFATVRLPQSSLSSQSLGKY